MSIYVLLYDTINNLQYFGMDLVAVIMIIIILIGIDIDKIVFENI